MLEAFVHDPLINWRLLVRPSPDDSSHTTGRSRAASETGTHSRRGSAASSSRRASALDDQAAAAAAAAALQGIVGLHGAADSEHRVGSSSVTPPHGGLFAAKPVSSSMLSSRGSLGLRFEALHHDERALNERALKVLTRVESKLQGTDFARQTAPLDVETQVNQLVMEARSNLNLCQLYVGWCAFW